MKLGILVTTDRNLDHIAGLTHAAIRKGHEATIFVMDDGVRLFGYSAFQSLCKIEGVSMCFCDYSTRLLGVSQEGMSKEIVCGSQYNNAVMNHHADGVIVL
ncbi:MAG TPA: hypothetical protein DCP92_18520 [Nitrospiraceae bacterium]|jgi:predicted peroxiredoxin|nr:hypothetical protein [Nitrospiraceae bacterium]